MLAPETGACRPHPQGLAGGSNTLSDITYIRPVAPDKLDEPLKTLEMIGLLGSLHVQSLPDCMTKISLQAKDANEG